MNVLGEAALSNYYNIVGVAEYECKDEYIKQALQQLDVFERTCLLLQIDGEFTIQDIADIVEKSQREVEIAIKDAREHVRQSYYRFIQQEKGDTELLPPFLLDCDLPGSGTECDRWQQELMGLSPGELSHPEYRSLRTHTEMCPSCRKRAEQYSQVNNMIHGIPTIKATTTPPEALLRLWEEQDRASSIPAATLEGKCLSPQTETPRGLTVFISYARKDKEYVDLLEQHLFPLKWRGLISHWYDYDVSAGSEWTHQILSLLDPASIIVLLISSDFVASDLCRDNAMQWALEKYKVQDIRVIPVVLAPVDWSKTPFQRAERSCPLATSLLPTNGKPVTRWHNKDKAFLNVVNGIQKVIGEVMLTRSAEQNGLQKPAFPFLESAMGRGLPHALLPGAPPLQYSLRSLPDASQNSEPAVAFDTWDENTWKHLWNILLVFARRTIFSCNVAYWRGQEYDLAEDVVQASILHIIERSHHREGTRTLSPSSLKRLTCNIASNYIKDLKRQEMHFTRENIYSAERVNHSEMVSETVTENIYREELFVQIAEEVKKFPERQRDALLMDLANHMQFDGKPTALNRAFLTVGINLQEYQKPLPLDPATRTRYSSLLVHAYKRLTTLQFNTASSRSHAHPLAWESTTRGTSLEDSAPQPIPFLPSSKKGNGIAM